MSQHNFGPLTAQYPGVIAKMPQVFTAHEFILLLAQENQRLYVEALYDYKDNPAVGAETPFLIVHGQLAKKLRDFPHLVSYMGDVRSSDIFATPSTSSQWRRI
ncbi:MAG: hypothetical protein JNK72_01010 [Myxococcales bacterium]|nr:hypothetical protein [Myxococcales bacterium]